MYLLMGVIPVAIIVLVVLHQAVFKRKIPLLSWVVLILVSVGLVALLGVGALHAGLIGLLTFLFGFLWLRIYHHMKNKNNKTE